MAGHFKSNVKAFWRSSTFRSSIKQCNAARVQRKWRKWQSVFGLACLRSPFLLLYFFRSVVLCCC